MPGQQHSLPIPKHVLLDIFSFYCSVAHIIEAEGVLETDLPMGRNAVWYSTAVRHTERWACSLLTDAEGHVGVH